MGVGSPSRRVDSYFLFETALNAAGRIRLRHDPPRRLAFGMCLMVFALASVLIGCGGGSSSSSMPTRAGTPKGFATFTVTATSGPMTISTPVTVTALAHFILLSRPLRRTPPPLRAQKFPEATSFRICFSRDSSATKRFSFAFSRCSSFIRSGLIASLPTTIRIGHSTAVLRQS
jgi:hypothetical protein